MKIKITRTETRFKLCCCFSLHSGQSDFELRDTLNNPSDLSNQGLFIVLYSYCRSWELSFKIYVRAQLRQIEMNQADE